MIVGFGQDRSPFVYLAVAIIFESVILANRRAKDEISPSGIVLAMAATVKEFRALNLWNLTEATLSLPGGEHWLVRSCQVMNALSPTELIASTLENLDAFTFMNQSKYSMALDLDPITVTWVMTASIPVFKLQPALFA